MPSITGERANEAEKQRVENLGSSCPGAVDSITKIFNWRKKKNEFNLTTT